METEPERSGLPPRVVVESPLRGQVPEWLPRQLHPMAERIGRMINRDYAKACVLDSLRRGEAPYASHVLFDQRGLLDDASHVERHIGMRAGRAWESAGELMAVYLDRGISSGMQAAIDRAQTRGQRIEYRRLFE